MIGTRSLTLTLETAFGPRGFGVEGEGIEGGLTVDGLAADADVDVDAREGRLRSTERLAKEKVDASECRIEALLLRGSVFVVVVTVVVVLEGLCMRGRRLNGSEKV